jgi:hypothetical protein
MYAADNFADVKAKEEAREGNPILHAWWDIPWPKGCDHCDLSMRAGKTDTEAECEGREAFTTRTSESAVRDVEGRHIRLYFSLLDRLDDVTHGRVNSEQQKQIYCERDRDNMQN